MEKNDTAAKQQKVSMTAKQRRLVFGKVINKNKSERQTGKQKQTKMDNEKVGIRHKLNRH